jgi:predicted RNase H-like nuclease (RuvC/YqgF family)
MASTDHLRAHHSRRSEQKREAVLEAARAMIRSGIQIEWAPLARRAGVSEKFIHDKKHSDVKAQVKQMIAAQAGRQAEREVAEDQATIASLRAELLNLRGQLQRKESQIAVLERKLSHQAGQQLEAELPRPPGSVIEQAERAGQRVLELEGRVRELQSQLDEREREILALRDSLRQTIRERNTGSS